MMIVPMRLMAMRTVVDGKDDWDGDNDDDDDDRTVAVKRLMMDMMMMRESISVETIEDGNDGMKNINCHV